MYKEEDLVRIAKREKSFRRDLGLSSFRRAVQLDLGMCGDSLILQDSMVGAHLY